jgi:nucleoside-diphosphate-sugar epimerase
LCIHDAATAYIRAIEAHPSISGIFYVASANYTVGEVGDLVKTGVEENMDMEVKLNIKHIQDYRNYKVSIDKARRVLSYKPRYDIEDIVKDLINNYDKFKDMDNPNYYNIQVFKTI